MDSTIVFAEDLPGSTVNDRVARKELTRLARGIYTTDILADPSSVVRRSWREIVGRRFPQAVVTDRSAKWAQPHDSYLFVSSHRDATLELPGLTVVSRKGPGPVGGDIAMGASVHLASRARALLDNTRPTRKRGERPPATLSRTELADWIDHLCAVDGPAAVGAYRDTAEALLGTLDASPKRVEALNELVGSALGTRASGAGSVALRARAAGVPYDQSRITRFELLAAHLRNVVTTHPALGIDASRRATLPFWEAYFSNFIEGTEFTPEEAERIVFAGEVPATRPEDAHDILATYQLVANDAEMRRRTTTASEFVELLKDWHHMILGGRPDKRPGQFKHYPNQAGNTVFVVPDLVEGTLRHGYDILESLTTPTQRGTFAAFVVAEVHPFDDGNGRLARAVMNAAYISGDEQRAVIPTISRNDYLRALRRLSRQDQPDLFVTYLDRIRRWTTQIDWSTLETARNQLARTHAFVDTNDAEDRGLQLLDPARAAPAMFSADPDQTPGRSPDTR
ncbi:MAG: Fic family protein [Acidimicrobiales bacterium]